MADRYILLQNKCHVATSAMPVALDGSTVRRARQHDSDLKRGSKKQTACAARPWPNIQHYHCFTCF